MGEVGPYTASANVGVRIGQQLDGLLLEGEAVIAVCVQHLLYALRHRRSVVAATNQRLITIQRPLIGGYRPFTVRWQDLRDVRLDVGPLTAQLDVYFSANHSDTAGGEAAPAALRLHGLQIAGAQNVFRTCQAQEQVWREKRRIRIMEEQRAAAGGVQIANLSPADRASGVGAPDLLAGGQSTPAQRLAQVRQLQAEGLITDAEAEAIKARVIAGL